MTIVIDNLEGENVDVSFYTSNLNYNSSLKDIFATLKFDLPYEYFDEKNLKVFSRVFASSGSDFEFIGIAINIEIDNLNRVSVTAVSDSFYITNYEELIKVKNYRADKVIKQVLTDYDSNFTIDSIPLQASITKIYNGESILGIIDDVIKQSEGASGRKIYRTFENGELKIFSDPEKYELDLEYAISDLKLAYNGEAIKTQIKVFTEEKEKITVGAIKKNIKLIEKAGVIQKVEKIKATEKSQADLIAENLLAIYGQIKRTGSFTLFGDYKARVGMGVTLEGGDYIISGLKHTIEDEIHLMSVSVIAYEKGN